ncbi:MAG: redoxin domain-containing protein [Armatimonadetes bacterium]|nr:redoxin domain-containing protein [Armatimonadota bacterium]
MKSQLPIRSLWIAFAIAASATAVLLALPHDAKKKLDPSYAGFSSDSAKQLQMRPQVDHPVTPEMSKVASDLSQKKAPAFNLKGTDGKEYSLTELTKDKPLLIFFVERECPCCLGAKYFVDRLIDLYPGQINAVGIINAKGAKAERWARVTKPRFIVLEDFEQKAIRAYSAERGVYTTLIAQGGTIAKAYPGYSKSMLQELSNDVANLLKVEPKKFVSKAAPDEMTSGCVFPDPTTDKL